ncbi:hypothetical protein [Streptomyces sp. NPDC005438]|uniref:hypothetical protein n=1 Tax=Streptomyces sp. NPDC005438 TaxID=3156880 RepID=UPI0033B92DF2
MGWVQALSLGVVFLTVIAVRQWVLYPGNWNEMFGEEYAAQRRALARRRLELRRAERSSSRHRAEAVAKVERAKRAHRALIRSHEELVRSLREREPGDHVTALGRVALHEHALCVYEEDGPLDEETGHRAPASGQGTYMWLADLTVECEAVDSPRETHLVLRAETERRVQVTYHHTEYPERFVRGLVVDIQHAITRAQKAREQRQREIADAELRLEEVREDREDIDIALTELKQVEAEEAVNPAIPRARAARETQRNEWETLTGRRPLL